MAGPHLILMCPASHLERLRDYVQAAHLCEALSEQPGLAATPAKREGQKAQRQTARLLFVRATDGDRLGALERLAGDENLSTVLQKAYLVHQHDEAPLPSLEAAAERLAKELCLLPAVADSAARVVRCASFPRSETPALTTLLQKFADSEGGQTFTLAPKGCDTVAAAVQAEGQWYTSCQDFRLSFTLDCGESDDISRAYFKLAEALRRAGAKIPEGAWAIDAGASPGGWTRFLAEQGCSHVFAVDPAELSPKVLNVQALPNGKPSAEPVTAHNVAPCPARVEHLQTTIAEAAVEVARRQKAGDVPALDVYVSDMMLQKRESAVGVLKTDGILELLRPGSLVVVTVKGSEVPGHSKRSFDKAISHIVEEFETYCEGVQSLHLMYNRERERTLVGYMRAQAHAL